MFSSDVEVDHLSGWTLSDWIVRLIVLYAWPIGFIALAVIIAGLGVIATSTISIRFLGLLITLLAGGVSIALVAWGIYRYTAVAFEMFRHTTAWGWSLGLAIALCLGWALLVVPVGYRVLAIIEPDAFPSRRHNKTDDCAVGGTWAFFAFWTVAAMLADWFHRFAASIPMAAATLATLIVLAAAGLFVWAMR